MEKSFSNIDFQAPSAARIRLLLLDDSGGHWCVTMSPGVERFIGCYPRLDAFVGDEQVLRYEVA